MQFKPITAIIVLLLVVASLLVAGCTTSNTSQTPSITPDPQLERYVAAYTQTIREDEPDSIIYSVTWNSSNAAQIIYDAWGTGQNETYTVTKFRSVNDASQYVVSHTSGYDEEKTHYNPNSVYGVETDIATAYQRFTGHLPYVYSFYTTWDRTQVPALPLFAIQTDQYVWEGG